MKTAMPLPLELTWPIELASPLEKEMAKTFGVGDTWYTLVTQVREIPRWDAPFCRLRQWWHEQQPGKREQVGISRDRCYC